MKKQVSVVLVGIGGYGNVYVEAILERGTEKGVVITGVVDPFPDGCKHLKELNAQGIPIFATLDDFYADMGADLAIISSPIHFHREQTCMALSKGSHVLCEKPVAALPAEAVEMMSARRQSGKFVNIGYQWSHSQAILDLKSDILSGVFGQPERLKTIVLWPRDGTYYRRRWAGKIKDDEGRLILDSVVNNATAHYLHNMFFVLGSSLNRSAAPIKVTAELYRANAIENFDTVAALIKTSEGADIYYYASHAVSESYGPVFEYTFQKGVISYCGGEGTQAGITAVFQDGSTKDYGDPNEETLNKLWVTVEAVRGENTIRCPIEAAFSHTLCIDGMHRSATVSNFPDTYKRLDSEREIVWVEELSQVLHQCYNNYKLPAELDVPWAIPGNTVEIEAAGKES